MRRVSASNPCPVCKKGDWCLIASDGTAAICKRVQSAKECGEAGWLHRLAEPVPPPPKKPQPIVTIKAWTDRAEKYAANLTPEQKWELAVALRLPADALDPLALLGYHPDDSIGPCFIFPETNENGTIIGLSRRFRDGKKMTVAGGKRGLTLPVGWRERPGPVFAVEGPTDTAALTAAGLCAIGRPSNNGGVRLLAELLKDLDAGRDIIIVGENDRKVTGDWPGRRGAEAVARGLAVRLGRPIPWALPPDESKDVRDWLTAEARSAVPWPERGAELVAHLTAAAVRIDPPDGAPVVRRNYAPPVEGETWNDPHRLARLFVAERRTADGEKTLVQWRDEYHHWDGAAWRPVPDSDLDADVARHCRTVFEADYPFRLAGTEDAGDEGSTKTPTLFPVTAQVRGNARVNLSALVNHPDTGADSPFWLDGGNGRPAPSEVIAAPNGLFTLTDIAAGRGPFAAPTPRFFTPNALPFAVPRSAPRPETWLRCLAEWFNGDAASIAGLQEWFGYLLSADTSAHKILMLVGPPRSGKGTILYVLTELAGAGNVASTSFAALGENFGLESLLGKRVAVIPDARLSGRTDVASVVERLLSISGEDAQTVNRKNRPRVTTKLRVRFILATNEVPRLPDAAGALASRFHILRTPNSWLGKEDKTLKPRLFAELPGILLWAAAGWVRLCDRGITFTPNDAAAEYQRELENLSSPIRAFVRECCRIGPEHEVEIPELYGAWRDWNGERNREVGSEQIFGRDLRSALPHIRVSQPRRDGCRLRLYSGVSLKPRGEWGEDEPPARDGTGANLTHALLDSAPLTETNGNVGCVRLAPVPSRANRRYRNDDRPPGVKW